MSSDWRDRAACRGAGAGLFFPDWAPSPAPQEIDRAKQMCRDCPVRARCLDWALDHGAAHGIWGGLTAEERRASRGMAIRKPSSSA